MTDNFSTEVVVMRKAQDGWFVYTCADLPGLYVAHRNDQVAYNDLPEAIRLLVKLNEGIDCAVSHAVPYSEFVRRMHNSDVLQKRTDDLMAAYPDMIRFILQADGAHTGSNALTNAARASSA